MIDLRYLGFTAEQLRAAGESVPDDVPDRALAYCYVLNGEERDPHWRVPPEPIPYNSKAVEEILAALKRR